MQLLRISIRVLFKLLKTCTKNMKHAIFRFIT